MNDTSMTDNELFVYDNDIVFRVWTFREEGQGVDSPSLLRAMIRALMEENKRLVEENKALKEGG